VIDLVPQDESDAAAKTRADKRAWLGARGYRVIAVPAAELEADAAAVLDRIDARIANSE
jgi:tRNA/rRNA methyltransferase